MPEGSQARTKGNEGAPTRSLTSESRVSRLLSRERSFSPLGRPGADQEYGDSGCQVEVNGCFPRRKGTRASCRTWRCRCIGSLPREKCRCCLADSLLPYSIAPCPSPRGSSSPLPPLTASPRSAPTPVGRYVAIGHSWPGSMMLAARV